MDNTVRYREARRARRERWAQTLVFVGALAVLVIVLVISFSVQSNERAVQRATRTAAADERATATARAQATATMVALDKILPAQVGTPLPHGSETISTTNGARLEEVARWAGTGVTAVAWAPDGQMLVVAASREVVFIDVPAFTEVARVDVPSPVWSVAFSSDGSLLGSGLQDGTVWLWGVAATVNQAVEDGWVAGVLAGHTGAVRDLAFSPDDALLASASLDRAIVLWDVPAALDSGTWTVTAPLSDQDGRWVWRPDLDSSKVTATVPLSTAFDGALMTTSSTQLLRGHRAGVYGVSFSPDGAWLASGSLDNTVGLWDLAAIRDPEGAVEKGVRFLDRPGDWVLGVDFGPEGRYLAAGSCARREAASPRCVAGEVLLWETAGAPVAAASILGHTSIIHGIDFSPDGALLAAGARDGTIRLWDIAALRAAPADGERELSVRRVLRTLKVPDGAVLGVAFSPDGTLLASASSKVVRLWGVVR